MLHGLPTSTKTLPQSELASPPLRRFCKDHFSVFLLVNAHLCQTFSVQSDAIHNAGWTANMKSSPQSESASPPLCQPCRDYFSGRSSLYQMFFVQADAIRIVEWTANVCGVIATRISCCPASASSLQRQCFFVSPGHTLPETFCAVECDPQRWMGCH
jgi:hypothetical protein